VLLAQGRYWRVKAERGAGSISLELRRSGLPEELQELRELVIEVPDAKWNLVVRHAFADRKLLGGLLLDFAKHKDRVSTAVGSDRLLAELRRVVLDATAAAVEERLLDLVPRDEGNER